MIRENSKFSFTKLQINLSKISEKYIEYLFSNEIKLLDNLIKRRIDLFKKGSNEFYPFHTKSKTKSKLDSSFDYDFGINSTSSENVFSLNKEIKEIDELIDIVVIRIKDKRYKISNNYIKYLDNITKKIYKIFDFYLNEIEDNESNEENKKFMIFNDNNNDNNNNITMIMKIKQ